MQPGLDPGRVAYPPPLPASALLDAARAPAPRLNHLSRDDAPSSYFGMAPPEPPPAGTGFPGTVGGWK